MRIEVALASLRQQPSAIRSLAIRSLARARIEALEGLLWDALEHLLGEGAEQPPRDLKRLEDGAVLIRALREAAEAK